MEEKQKKATLPECKESHLVIKSEEESEVKDKKEHEIEKLLRDILEKLRPEEKEQLWKVVDSRLHKDIEPKDKEAKLEIPKHDVMNHPKPPVPNPIKDMQETELSIELHTNKGKLIKILNDINCLLQKNHQEDYHIKVKKIEKRK